MPDILSTHHHKGNVFKSLWHQYRQLDRFLKIAFVTYILITLSTPFIVGGYQVFKSDSAQHSDSETIAITVRDSDNSPPVRHQVSSTSYILDQQVISGVDKPLRIRGLVRHPTDLNNGPYPLVILNHLNAKRCLNPETSLWADTDDYNCPQDFQEKDYAEGMVYLAEELAESGMIAVSIEANQLMHFSGSVYTIPQSLRNRAYLLRDHLLRWRNWASVGGAPFGNQFVGAVDLNRVGIAGHSNGGYIATQLPSILENAPLSGVTIRSIYLLATSDNQSIITNIPMGVMLGSCDGDPGAQGLPGLHVVDRSSGSNIAPVSQLYLVGANHSQFNTSSDTQDTGCDSSYIIMQPKTQQSVAKEIISRWFAATLNDKEVDLFMKGEAPLPASIQDAIEDPLDLHWSFFDSTVITLDDFDYRDVDFRGVISQTNKLGGEIKNSGFTEAVFCSGQRCKTDIMSNSYYYFKHHKPTYSLTWDTLGAVVRWGLMARDFSAYRVLAFRAAQTLEEARNQKGQDQDFKIRLIDTTSNAAELKVSEVGRIPYPFNEYGQPCYVDNRGFRTCSSWWQGMPREILHSIRIPLDEFNVRNPALNLSSLKTLEFEMGIPERPIGRLLISDVEFSGSVGDPPILRILDSDVNNNGFVLGDDISFVNSAFGALKGDSKYKEEYDLDGSGSILASDISLIISHFGLTWPPTNLLEGKTLTFYVTGNDLDSDTLTLSATNLPSGATFDPSTGRFNWTPSSSQAGTYNITFKVSDGKLEDSEILPITVIDVP